MLLMPNKKKIATIIVAGLGKRAMDDSHVQKMGEESGTGEYKLPEDTSSNDGIEAAMDDFLRAADRKDAKAMARAFKNALVLCEDDYNEAD